MRLKLTGTILALGALLSVPAARPVDAQRFINECHVGGCDDSFTGNDVYSFHLRGLCELLRAMGLC